MNVEVVRKILFWDGLVVTVIGIVLIVLGMDGLRTPIACTVNGCPSIFSSTYAAYWDKIYAGLAVVVIGVAIMLVSRRLKTDEQSKQQ